MLQIEIKDLKDVPEFAEACAAWSYGYWGVHNPNKSFKSALELFTAKDKPEGLPITVVVINKESNTPVAMGSLLLQDGDDWPDNKPWIAYIYTTDRFRGHGLAKVIVEELEIKTKSLGYDKVYLHSSSAVDMYLKFGYQEEGFVTTKKGKRVLLSKSL